MMILMKTVCWFIGLFLLLLFLTGFLIQLEPIKTALLQQGIKEFQSQTGLTLEVEEIGGVLPFYIYAKNVQASKEEKVVLTIEDLTVSWLPQKLLGSRYLGVAANAKNITLPTSAALPMNVRIQTEGSWNDWKKFSSLVGTVYLQNKLVGMSGQWCLQRKYLWTLDIYKGLLFSPKKPSKALAKLKATLTVKDNLEISSGNFELSSLDLALIGKQMAPALVSKGLFPMKKEIGIRGTVSGSLLAPLFKFDLKPALTENTYFDTKVAHL